MNDNEFFWHSTIGCYTFSHERKSFLFTKQLVYQRIHSHIGDRRFIDRHTLKNQLTIRFRSEPYIIGNTWLEYRNIIRKHFNEKSTFGDYIVCVR